MLESRKRELAVQDLDLAAFIVVTLIESLTHAAVLHRQDLVGERFIREVTKVVAGYLSGEKGHRP